VLYTFLGVQEKKFDRTVQTFAALWREFCRLLVEVLQCFAGKKFERAVQTFDALWQEF